MALEKIVICIHQRKKGRNQEKRNVQESHAREETLRT